MKIPKWQYFGDVNMLDYGGKNSRCIGGRQYQFIEFINMEDACGRDNEGQPKYNVELRLVDLAEIKSGVLKQAMDCCGFTPEIDNEGNAVMPADNILAEFCDSYGAHAPLGQWNGNNARNLMRTAYREANALLDPSQLEAKLEATVNKIGSSAREFMKGDIFSGIQRGCESGDPDARLTAKIYGIPEATINDCRPDDWLPYLFGYTAAMAGRAKETDPDTAPEYFRGYERGEKVKAGQAQAPGWIKTAGGQSVSPFYS